MATLCTHPSAYSIQYHILINSIILKRSHTHTWPPKILQSSWRKIRPPQTSKWSSSKSNTTTPTAAGSSCLGPSTVYPWRSMCCAVSPTRWASCVLRNTNWSLGSWGRVGDIMDGMLCSRGPLTLDVCIYSWGVNDLLLGNWMGCLLAFWREGGYFIIFFWLGGGGWRGRDRSLRGIRRLVGRGSAEGVYTTMVSCQALCWDFWWLGNENGERWTLSYEKIVISEEEVESRMCDSEGEVFLVRWIYAETTSLRTVCCTIKVVSFPNGVLGSLGSESWPTILFWSPLRNVEFFPWRKAWSKGPLFYLYQGCISAPASGFSIFRNPVFLLTAPA